MRISPGILHDILRLTPQYMSTTIAQGARRAPLAFTETSMTKTTRKPPAKPTTKPAKPAPKAYILFGADEYAKPRAARFSTTDRELLAKAAQAMSLRLFEAADPELAEIAKQLPAGRLHASGQGLVPYIKADLYDELVAATVGEQQPAPGGPSATTQPLPASWEEVAAGHLVIAKETHECGWWEAVVIERNGDLVTLRYRDIPNYPNLVRHRSVVALICPPAQ
jgi:hypothetical protein